MSDIESEGEIIYKAQQAAIDEARIRALIARVESLEMKLVGVGEYNREMIHALAEKTNDCQKRLVAIEAKLSDDAK